MQTRRAFIAKYAPVWAARAAAHRTGNSPAGLRIADALDRIVAGMEAKLAALPIDPPSHHAAPRTDAVTWRSPVFWPGGRFNPWAGTYREAMLASADACERLGAPDAARACRARAAAIDDGPATDATSASSAAMSGGTKPRAVWSGPNLPPPEPAPFVAGPQLGLFA